MSTNAKTINYLAEPIVWHQTTDPVHPFAADVDSDHFLLRLNNFPEEPLYTLLINGHAVTDLEDWPNTWSRKS